MVLRGDKWKVWDQTWGPQETGVKYRFCVYVCVYLRSFFFLILLLIIEIIKVRK